VTEPTEHDRRRAADNALASLALENLQPSQPTRDLLDAAVRGELTPDQLYEEVLRLARESGQQ
jgi:Antitoxin VbhA